MRQEGDSVTTVIRPTWKGSDEQNELLAEAVAAAESAREAENTAWARIKTARDAGVPDTVLCRRADVSRATLNRRLGSRSADDPAE